MVQKETVCFQIDSDDRAAQSTTKTAQKPTRTTKTVLACRHEEEIIETKTKGQLCRRRMYGVWGSRFDWVV